MTNGRSLETDFLVFPARNGVHCKSELDNRPSSSESESGKDGCASLWPDDGIVGDGIVGDGRVGDGRVSDGGGMSP